MYSISDLKNYDDCKNYFWFVKHKGNMSSSMIHNHEDCIKLCKELLMIPNAYDASENSMLDIKNVFDSETAIIHASFMYYHLQITIPIMIKGKKGWNVYFPYEVCYPKEEEIQYIADHLHVLASFYIPVEDIFIIHLDAEYDRGDTLEVQKLFKITEYIHSSNWSSDKKIKDLLPYFDRNLLFYQREMDTYLKNKVMNCKFIEQCGKGTQCPYYHVCLPCIKKDTSILHLNSCTYGFDMHQEDTVEVDVNQIEVTRLQYAQIMAARLNGLYCDTHAVKMWLRECIHYPISYLDFAWDTFAIPPYPRMKPYDSLCFQYSLHIENEHEQVLQHKQFLGTGDCRLAFIEQLLKDIPKEGSIMVYHMESAEKLRLKQLAMQFPQYKNTLYKLCDRMVDLSLPFFSASLYDSRMCGQYSLKTLLSLYSTIDYRDFSISNSLDAVKKWRSLEAANEIEKEQICKELYAYYKMDTYAEYVVFHAIKDIVREKEKEYFEKYHHS